MRGPDKNYAVQVKLKLKQSLLQKLDDVSESVDCLQSSRTEQLQCKHSIQPRSKATLRVKVVRPVVQGKAQTREADVVKEVKRGSMKEKWGLTLSYSSTHFSLELVVTKVAKFSPAYKVGLQEGNTITMIGRLRQWSIHRQP